MVNDHVGDGADACLLEGLDERPQLSLGTKRAVVVGKPVEVVVAHRLSAAVGALRYPHEVELLAEVPGLLLEVGPLGIPERVPIESL